ncbi:MAG: urease accessory protein UreE [Burkholderiales bacterium]
MIEIKAKLKIARAAYKLEVKGRLELPFASRRQSGARARLVSGEEVVLNLPRGEVLRGGDLATASDGRVIEVIAVPEPLWQVVCPNDAQLARLAWHLGSAHVPVEMGEGWLRVAVDHDLEAELRRLGGSVTAIEAPFEPEVETGKPHAHGHDHDDHGHHHHGHDHGHEH